MSKEKPIWSGKRIMERWNSSPTELASFIYHGLPAFRMEKGSFIQVKPEEIQHYDENQMTDLLFRPLDIEEFEKQPGIIELMADRGGHLSPQEARELGGLREEKKKWDASIQVAVQAGVHFANQGGTIIRNDLSDYIFAIDRNIPNTTIDKIWRALPGKYKKGSGRPRKE